MKKSNCDEIMLLNNQIHFQHYIIFSILAYVLKMTDFEHGATMDLKHDARGIIDFMLNTNRVRSGPETIKKIT